MNGDELLKPFRFPYGIYKYVRREVAMAACEAGWLPLPALDGTHHGEYSVLMVWLCQCPMKVFW